MGAVVEIPALTPATAMALAVAVWAYTRPVLESDTTSVVTLTTAWTSGVLTVEAPPRVCPVLLVALVATVWRLLEAALAAAVSAPKLLRLRAASRVSFEVAGGAGEETPRRPGAFFQTHRQD